MSRKTRVYGGVFPALRGMEGNGKRKRKGMPRPKGPSADLLNFVDHHGDSSCAFQNIVMGLLERLSTPPV